MMKIRSQLPNSDFFSSGSTTMPQRAGLAAAGNPHRFLQFGMQALDRRIGIGEGDRQEPRDERDHDQRAEPIQRERRRRIGGIKADRQHDAGHRERRQVMPASQCENGSSLRCEI